MQLYRYIAIAALVIFLGACGVKTPPPAQETPIPLGKFYFYSKTCSHCAKVEAYINDNAVRQNFYFISRDVENDRTAYALMIAVAKRCQLSGGEIAVPLFWDGERCFVGDTAVISYLQNTVR